MMRGSFEDLKIWQKSMALVRNIYKITRDFPKEERFDLTSQMRRAAISIPSNIAEGSQRISINDFGHFILIAKGSLAELRTQLYIAADLEYLPQKQARELLVDIEEINKMIFSFHKALKSEI